jgi:hypothetical protein
MGLSMGESHHAYDGVVRWEGTNQPREFITDETAHHADGFYCHSVHVQGNNVVIHIDGDVASGRSDEKTAKGRSRSGSAGRMAIRRRTRTCLRRRAEAARDGGRSSRHRADGAAKPTT